MSVSEPPLQQGSSPRIRGESHTKPATTKRTGIIPANTGRMKTRDGRIFTMRDHPREYGENLPDNLKLAAAAGSSPRIRGE